jgi:hypothetical protein
VGVAHHGNAHGSLRQRKNQDYAAERQRPPRGGGRSFLNYPTDTSSHRQVRHDRSPINNSHLERGPNYDIEDTVIRTLLGHDAQFGFRHY